MKDDAEGAADHVSVNYGPKARRALLDLQDFVKLGEQLSAQGRRSYDENICYRLAAEAIVHRVSQAVARLPAALTEAHPEIEFSLARGMRNRVAHQYQGVDYVIVWQVLSVDLPNMSRQVAQLLED